jgi:RND family efflux transporter MFP subunit
MLVGPENTVQVRKEIIRSGPRLSGVLEPREQARVRAETGGSVTWEAVELGKPVKKGQVLVRIEDAALRNASISARSALRSANLALENATLQRNRTRKLVQAGALSAHDLEVAQIAQTSAEAAVAQTRAQLAAVKKQLESATVEAPMAGVISENTVHQGDVVANGTPLFTVIDPSSMRLEASVPSENLQALKVGTRVDFDIRGLPGQSFTGRIERVAPAADPATRQITILVALPNPGGKLLAGLFAEGRIGAESKTALVVPSTAIDLANHPPSVLRVQDGRIDRVSVTLGLQDPQTERVEVQGPLREGDVLLTGAAKEIAPGSQVTLTGAGSPAIN